MTGYSHLDLCNQLLKLLITAVIRRHSRIALDQRAARHQLLQRHPFSPLLRSIRRIRSAKRHQKPPAVLAHKMQRISLPAQCQQFRRHLHAGANVHRSRLPARLIGRSRLRPLGAQTPIPGRIPRQQWPPHGQQFRRGSHKRFEFAVQSSEFRIDILCTPLFRSRHLVHNARQLALLHRRRLLQLRLLHRPILVPQPNIAPPSFARRQTARPIRAPLQHPARLNIQIIIAQMRRLHVPPPAVRHRQIRHPNLQHTRQRGRMRKTLRKLRINPLQHPLRCRHIGRTISAQPLEIGANILQRALNKHIAQLLRRRLPLRPIQPMHIAQTIQRAHLRPAGIRSAQLAARLEHGALVAGDAADANVQRHGVQEAHARGSHQILLLDARPIVRDIVADD